MLTSLVDARVSRFLLVGAGATTAYAVLYLGLRDLLGPSWANVAALVLSTLASTAGNRHLTFHSTAHATAAPHHALGLGLVVAGLGLTSTSLDLLAAVDPSAGRVAEVVVLGLANAVVGTLRFVVFSLAMVETEAAGGRFSPRSCPRSRSCDPAR